MKSIKTDRESSFSIGYGRREAWEDGYSFTHWQILHVRIHLHIIHTYGDRKSHETQLRKSFRDPSVHQQGLMVLVDDLQYDDHRIGRCGIGESPHPKYIAGGD